MFIKKAIKKILRFQHKYFPLNIQIYEQFFKYKFSREVLFKKYGLLCFDTDFRENNNLRQDQKYWFTKRSLYWHFTHLHEDRFTTQFKFIHKKFPHIFNNKKIVDVGTGLGPVYFQSNFKIAMTMIEPNKYCCDFLKKFFPQNTIVNDDWKYLKSIKEPIDTLIMIGGVLMYMDNAEVELFFDITKNVKNFVIIHEGSDQDKKFYHVIKKNEPDKNYDANLTVYEYDIKKRLSKINNFYKNSDIFINKVGNNIYDTFVMSSKN